MIGIEATHVFPGAANIDLSKPSGQRLVDRRRFDDPRADDPCASACAVDARPAERNGIPSYRPGRSSTGSSNDGSRCANVGSGSRTSKTASSPASGSDATNIRKQQLENTL
jgi:hypothetical protein